MSRVEMEAFMKQLRLRIELKRRISKSFKKYRDSWIAVSAGLNYLESKFSMDDVFETCDVSSAQFLEMADALEMSKTRKCQRAIIDIIASSIASLAA